MRRMICAGFYLKSVMNSEGHETLEKIFVSRGSKSLDAAKPEALDGVTAQETREAISHLMSYWQDYLRSTLLSLACEAVGGDPRLAQRVSIPLILVCGAFDVHDDIIDNSKLKNSRLTVLGKSGAELTLLAGDVLLIKGLTSITTPLLQEKVPNETVVAIMNVLRSLLIELTDGETLELRLRGRTDVTPEEYVKIMRIKAADGEAYTRIGATLGNGTAEEVEALAEYGRLLGLIVILRDDLTDTLDFEAELPHRLKHEHIPLPIIYAMNNPMARKIIEPLCQKSHFEKQDVKAIIQTAYEFGGFKSYEKLIRGLAQDCVKRLNVLPPTEAKKALKIIVNNCLPPSLSNLEF